MGRTLETSWTLLLGSTAYERVPEIRGVGARAVVRGGSAPNAANMREERRAEGEAKSTRLGITSVSLCASPSLQLLRQRLRRVLAVDDPDVSLRDNAGRNGERVDAGDVAAKVFRCSDPDVELSPETAMQTALVPQATVRRGSVTLAREGTLDPQKPSDRHLGALRVRIITSKGADK